MASKKADEGKNCIERIRYSQVKAHDPGTGKSVVLSNPTKTQVRRIRMDGCLMPIGKIAADFLVSMPAIVDLIIELKGKNVDHGARQIEATRLFWSQHPEHQSNQLVSAWILCREYPRADLKINRFREDFRKHGGILLISTRNGEERPFTDFVPTQP